MQAVILAAGKGTRMGELVAHVPKPMIQINGEPLLGYKLDALPLDVKQVIIVVGHLGNVVREYFGAEYRGRQLTYVVQENPTGGTADALWQAKPLLTERFFVMNGDNIYVRKDMKECATYEWSALVQTKEHLMRAARVEVDLDNRITGITENVGDQEDETSGYANTGLYVLDMRIFDLPQVPRAPDSTEVGLPQTMMQAAKNINIHAVSATQWIEIKRPEDVEKAAQKIKEVDILAG